MVAMTGWGARIRTETIRFQRAVSCLVAPPPITRLPTSWEAQIRTETIWFQKPANCQLFYLPLNYC